MVPLCFSTCGKNGADAWFTQLLGTRQVLAAQPGMKGAQLGTSLGMPQLLPSDCVVAILQLVERESHQQQQHKDRPRQPGKAAEPIDQDEVLNYYRYALKVCDHGGCPLAPRLWWLLAMAS